jgi:hypothetical protein
LEKISRRKLDDPTEADTRSKIIDPILQECLNWQHDDIFREEYANPGFVDYVLKIGNRNVLVIEAKREGYSFKLPITFGFVRKYTLGGVLGKEKSIADPIKQARRYCSDKGTRFGAITNGDQFIVFETEKFGRDWSECNCRVFYNFDDIKRNFMDFWNLFSKDAIEKGALVNELSKGPEELNFIRPVDDIHFKNEFEPRNELYRYLIPIINRTFKEMTERQNIEMLKECYVVENEFEEVSSSLKNYLRPIADKGEFKEVKQGEEHAGIFHTDFYNKMEMLKQSPPNPTICLLLGGIGSGKTTFVFRFFNIVLIEEERQKVKWFYVDFRNAPTDKQSIRSYILKNILEEFRSKYGDLLEKYLKELKMEKVEPTIEDISKLFLVLKFEGFIPSLVIDNVDQHIFESPDYHESVFLEANNMTKELRTITIMTLREESFYGSSIGGVFDAYYIEQYRITPPDFRKLVIHRLEYILRKLALSKDELQDWLGLDVNYERQIEDIREFFNIIKVTLQQRANRSVSRFVSRTSGGNMRRALELFANFLVSGNTKVHEILETQRREGSYIIAEHQFVRSIVLGNHRYYSKSSSYLMNIFDFDPKFTQSHFLKLKILRYAEDQMAVDSSYGGGFVSINRIAADGSEISVSREAIEDALLQMATFGLVMLNTRSCSDMTGASHFCLTECGVYFLHILINRFSYVDLVLAHTPIADVDLSLKIRRMLPNRELEVRFERTRLFLDYLKRMEEREFENFPEYKLSRLGKYRFTERMLANFVKEQEYIIKSQRRKSLLLPEDMS